jgi:uncharacterized protein YecE (DUF72 family)
MRLMRAKEAEPTGYGAAALADWAARLRMQAATGDAFAFFISGAKVRNPAAALALSATI